MDLNKTIKICYGIAERKGLHKKIMTPKKWFCVFNSALFKIWDEVEKGKPLDQIYFKDTILMTDQFSDGISISLKKDKSVFPGNTHNACLSKIEPHGFIIKLADLVILLLDYAGISHNQITYKKISWLNDELATSLYLLNSELLQLRAVARNEPEELNRMLTHVIMCCFGFAAQHRLDLELAIELKCEYEYSLVRKLK